nr:collagen alpha-1(II) chain-like [Taeniopygia guttata]
MGLCHIHVTLCHVHVTLCHIHVTVPHLCHSVPHPCCSVPCPCHSVPHPVTLCHVPVPLCHIHVTVPHLCHSVPHPCHCATSMSLCATSMLLCAMSLSLCATSMSLCAMCMSLCHVPVPLCHISGAAVPQQCARDGWHMAGDMWHVGSGTRGVAHRGGSVPCPPAQGTAGGWRGPRGTGAVSHHSPVPGGSACPRHRPSLSPAPCHRGATAGPPSLSLSGLFAVWACCPSPARKPLPQKASAGRRASGAAGTPGEWGALGTPGDSGDSQGTAVQGGQRGQGGQQKWGHEATTAPGTLGDLRGVTLGTPRRWGEVTLGVPGGHNRSPVLPVWVPIAAQCRGRGRRAPGGRDSPAGARPWGWGQGWGHE